jgi:hypothetical protein
MSFETRGVAVNPSAAPSAALRDLHDFVTYNQSTQGHLNAGGRSHVRRGYPSPP